MSLEIEEEGASLSITEVRVLACLMEKELTVPDSYPLTLNSLVLACNQKSNREPEMHIDEGEVGRTTKVLEERGLAQVEYGERARRIMHKMCRAYNLDKRQQSLLTIMMLRNPQTLNDLKTRTKRMVEFADNEDVLQTLESLNDGELTLMKHLPRGAGQREDRYTHLLCGDVAVSTPPVQANISSIAAPDQDQITTLKSEITALTERVALLEAKLSDR
jgi:uncharacterized protein YceH (UPF0502 family)